MKVPPAEVERRLERFKTLSRKVGVKLTHQRLEIFRELAASLEHPDAETVFRGVKKRLPTVSLDTVYRTLWHLHDLGIITTLCPRRESMRFDANLNRHHHFICTQCGLTRDFESPAFDALTVPHSVTALGHVEATQVQVRGLCLQCATRRKTHPRTIDKEENR